MKRKIFGACILPTDLAPAPMEIAKHAEKLALDALFFAENSHVPVVHSKNKYHSEEIVEPFARMYDSFTTLAACSAVTNKIMLGTGVSLLTERDPIITAKAIATLDHISKGRIIFGIAGGWIKEAMENHGTSFKDRWAKVKESADLIKNLWREEKTVWNGNFFSIKNEIIQFPKPFTPGGPPIYIGSNHKKVSDRVAEYADGWMPIYNRYEGELDPVSALKKSCEKYNRNFKEMTIYLFGAPHELKLLSELSADGYDGFIFLIPPEKGNAILESLDEIANTRNKFLETHK